ncbi:MAG: hypothetical protein P8X90_20265, partial [Desulfobacterales bacterium]
PGISEFSHSVDAEYTLKNYLDYRDKRKFQKCCDYYTAGFKKRFIRSFGNTCPDWFRESEMDFKESRIVGSKRGNLNRFTVESTIDDPTANAIYAKVTEHYDLIVEKGEWKIDNWSIEYK